MNFPFEPLRSFIIFTRFFSAALVLSISVSAKSLYSQRQNAGIHLHPAVEASQRPLSEDQEPLIELLSLVNLEVQTRLHEIQNEIHSLNQCLYDQMNLECQKKITPLIANIKVLLPFYRVLLQFKNWGPLSFESVHLEVISFDQLFSRRIPIRQMNLDVPGLDDNERLFASELLKAHLTKAAIEFDKKNSAQICQNQSDSFMMSYYCSDLLLRRNQYVMLELSRFNSSADIDRQLTALSQLLPILNFIQSTSTEFSTSPRSVLAEAFELQSQHIQMEIDRMERLENTELYALIFYQEFVDLVTQLNPEYKDLAIWFLERQRQQLENQEFIVSSLLVASPLTCAFTLGAGCVASLFLTTTLQVLRMIKINGQLQLTPQQVAAGIVSDEQALALQDSYTQSLVLSGTSFLGLGTSIARALGLFARSQSQVIGATNTPPGKAIIKKAINAGHSHTSMFIGRLNSSFNSEIHSLTTWLLSSACRAFDSNALSICLGSLLISLTEIHKQSNSSNKVELRIYSSLDGVNQDSFRTVIFIENQEYEEPLVIDPHISEQPLTLREWSRHYSATEPIFNFQTWGL